MEILGFTEETSTSKDATVEKSETYDEIFLTTVEGKGGTQPGVKYNG